MHRTNHIVLALIWLSLCLRVCAIEAEVVIVVSSKSPVSTLSSAEIANIFLGKSTRFPDGSKVTAIDQSETSSAREAFYAEIAGKSPAQMKAHWSKVIFTGRGRPPRSVSNGIELKRLLSEDLSAIGYIDETQVDSSVKVLRTR